jgi:hypothetical protein
MSGEWAVVILVFFAAAAGAYIGGWLGRRL